MNTVFKGVFSALPTFFTDDGSVDIGAFEKLIESQIEAGITGVIPCGTTGETPTLTSEEKKSLIKTAVRLTQGRAITIAGTGTNNTQTTIENSMEAQALGAQALLVVTPYYNKPSQRGLEAHYLALANQVNIPIILYNVPGRTGVSFTAETVAKLSTHPMIVGIKEATGNLDLFKEMKSKVSEKSQKPFTFLTGDDPTYWPFLLGGGDGVISVASNIIPKAMISLYKAAQNKDLAPGNRLFESLLPLFKNLFIESNPVPLKYLLSKVKGYPGAVRLPLVGLSDESVLILEKTWTDAQKVLNE